jgi:hypothetical protein
MALTFAFDIGYASIGWCALSSESAAVAVDPEVLGTGVVTFPTDDCLASQRRDLRRTRRHIRSTRVRIERMKRWLAHRGVLSREDLDRPGHPAPFLLAAAALRVHRTLTAWELWTVLRWYAHNRGYDGNSRWARGEEEAEDTEKVGNANAQMQKNGTVTMCETVCACLGLDPAHSDERISSALPYKTLNAAYPRKVVTAEVGRLLSLHLDRIAGLDSLTVRLLLKEAELTEEERQQLQSADIRLPKRYFGGLLFGQLVPRFDNRIIARCPVTWAKTYDDARQEGKTDGEARKLADKLAKVPAAKSKEFLEYRFARVLANLRANGEPIDKELRATLWRLAEKQGRLTHSDIAKAVKDHCGQVPTNLEAYFKLHPDSEEALVLDPVMDEVRKAEASRAKLSPVWKHLPEQVKRKAIGQWQKGKNVSFAWLLDQCKGMDGESEVKAALEKSFADEKPKKGKTPFASFDDYLLKTGVGPKFPTGRAPYARPVLRQVVEEVKNGWDSTKADKTTDSESGEEKPSNGVLYELGIPTSRVRQLQAERPIEQLTNNHLVRHRMLILERLLDDLLTEFCPDGRAPDQIVVEVARELKEFSGMTAKQIASELNSRLKDFKAAVAYLEKNAPHLLEDRSGRGSILRKCRIAMDLDWYCPFTGEKYDAADLPKLEREHIIPYATRNTNALHALVLTWPEVNRMKGKRTARQFILDDGGKQVPSKERLSLFTAKTYDAFVEKLDAKGHIDDTRRKKARKALLATTDFEDKELGFTEGQLTQTSQLMKLAMGAIRHKLPGTAIHPVPGPITAEIRKAWKLTGTLALACPEVLDPEGNVLPKDEIRGLTHLHHALDAATLAIAAHYFPLTYRGQDQKGKIWQALLRRYRNAEEKEFLHRTGIFERYTRKRRDKQGNEYTEPDVRLADLPAGLKNALARSLAECRVMQHLPSDRSGAKAELTTWGVVSINGEGEDARVQLRQRASTVEEGKRKIAFKSREERAGKLLGTQPKGGRGKLKEINGAMIIGENYGLALDPEPEVIPFHNVQQRLDSIRAKNGGKPVRVLRNGMLIRLSGHGGRDGIWRIDTIQATGHKLDLIKPHLTAMKELVTLSDGTTTKRNRKGSEVWRERPYNSLHVPDQGKFLEVLPRRYTGYSIAD